MRRVAVVLALVWFALAPSSVAQEHERIISFHTDIVANTDASLTITETIRVYATGDQIKRGIFRDFVSGNLELISVRRDGSTEDYHWDGNRLYLGNASIYLDQGESS